MRRAAPALCLLAGLAALLVGGALPAQGTHAAATGDETLTVSARSAQPAVSRPLDPTHDYLLKVSGTIGVHTGVASECDALFCFAGKVSGPIANLRVNQEGQSIAQVGRCKPVAVSYSRKHAYAYTLAGVSGPLRFFFADNPDGYSDNSGAFTISISDLGEGTGNCGVRWPALPDPLIPLATVANGCGPSDHATAADRTMDTGDYTATFETGARFRVSFRPACDQHDAGYSHAKVRDMALNGSKVIDYFTWTRQQIDSKFLADMLKICAQAIPASEKTALKNCNAGARARYAVVFAAGNLGSYDDAPDLAGLWVGQAGREALVGDGWVFRQNARNVTATWRYPAEKGKTGEFRGVIISGDGSSTLTGHFITTDADGTSTKPAPLRFTWMTKTPRRLLGSAGFNLAR